ncbi:PIN domain-containing protein [Luteococcus japonicus]|uniref:PIN domain-containing protein n=1 Tax=Luteococcus japonicus TaxID=33984 RepID=A0A3N1ZW75_9ACTN|nr:PIN domain-containing protein [Luteococcus japonicus]
MDQSKSIVLDANILIRLVLGRRVRALVLDHVDQVEFFTPGVCFDDARKYLPSILDRRGVASDGIQDALEVLDGFEGVVRPLDESVYGSARVDALARIASRDAADWPILAVEDAHTRPRSPWRGRSRQRPAGYGGPSTAVEMQRTLNAGPLRTLDNRPVRRGPFKVEC